MTLDLDAIKALPRPTGGPYTAVGAHERDAAVLAWPDYVAAVDALTAEVSMWKAHHDEQVRRKRNLHARHLALRSEVARLRAALTEVAACSVDPEWERYGDPHADLLRVVLLASAALAGGEG
jgi:hypothetical protein